MRSDAREVGGCSFVTVTGWKMLPEVLKKIYTQPTPLEKNTQKKQYENSIPLKMKNKKSVSPQQNEK